MLRSAPPFCIANPSLVWATIICSWTQRCLPNGHPRHPSILHLPHICLTRKGKIIKPLTKNSGYLFLPVLLKDLSLGAVSKCVFPKRWVFTWVYNIRKSNRASTYSRDRVSCLCHRPGSLWALVPTLLLLTLAFQERSGSCQSRVPWFPFYTPPCRRIALSRFVPAPTPWCPCFQPALGASFHL